MADDHAEVARANAYLRQDERLAAWENARLDPPDEPLDEPLAACGCPEWDCTPAVDKTGSRYCQACDNDLPHGRSEYTPLTGSFDPDVDPF